MIHKLAIVCVFLAGVLPESSFASDVDSTRFIHVFVALCDNENQGIVPVPAHLGKGDDPAGNLYWGARFGVKTFLKKSSSWKIVSCEAVNDLILERCIFRHTSEHVYLIADAYKGKEIKPAIGNFLEAASGGLSENIAVASQTNLKLATGGKANLLIYVGHNGLMDYWPQSFPVKKDSAKREVMILACASKPYFLGPVRRSGAIPILWTTGLLAPEAYVLSAAVDGWIANEAHQSIQLRAAEAYNLYQKCGLKAARNLFKAGW